MKLLFVQLSDMHCQVSNEKMFRKLEKAVAAINTLGKVDGAVLIFSGDLTDKNTRKEFSVGRKMIGKFLSDLGNALNCGMIHSVIVPGNHDMYLPDGCRNGAEIETWNLEDHIEDELSRLSNFFSYSQTKQCFIEDKLCDVRMLTFGKVKVQLCMLNSAPFSTRKREDKQLHYFPAYVAEKLERANETTLKITVMHHHYEWCEWDTKEMLKKAIASDDITFFGHDHKAESFTTQYSDGCVNNIIMGGEFNLDISKSAEFNAVIFDSDNKSSQRFEFVWSVEDGIFVPKPLGAIALKKIKLSPSVEYLSALLEDNQGIGHSLLDYYVLPKLTAEGGAFATEEQVDEVSVDDIFKALSSEKAIRITGSSGSGKTAFLKYLYCMSIEFGFVPLLIENRDYKDSKIEKMYMDLFEEQYGDPSEFAYAMYKQVENGRKIVFVDNIDLISNSKARKNLINSILEDGKLLVYTTCERNQDLEEIVKNRLEGKTISTLDICPVYKETRDKMVENVAALYSRNNDEIEAIKASLDYFVQCQTGMFTFTPGNTLQYIKYFLDGSAREKRGTQTISLIFETNIRNAIIKECKNDEDATLYLAFLEFLADYMYFTLRVEKIEIAQFVELVTLFNKKRRADQNAKQLLTLCAKANILKQAADSFDVKFYDKNTYAYFVAKAINRQFEKNSSDQTKLKYVMEHICFGINDTIILFLSFIRSNTQIIMEIAKDAQSLMEEYPEWDFQQMNIPFLHESADMPKGMPSGKDKKEAHRHSENVEKERHDLIKFRGIFDYNEDDVNKKRYVVLRALKYVQLIGRAFVDQYGSLEDDEIDQMVGALYSIPQKVIYATLKPHQDHSEEIIQSIVAFAKERLPEEKITEEKVREMFGQAGTILALNILNDIAFNAANHSTITVLREWDAPNANHKILKLMMEENVGDTPVFVQKAISSCEDLKDNLYARMLIAQIARKHIIYTGSISHREVDKLLSGKVLSAESKPKLLLSKGTGTTEQ